jgi:hypothetical protein
MCSGLLTHLSLTPLLANHPKLVRASLCQSLDLRITLPLHGPQSTQLPHLKGFCVKFFFFFLGQITFSLLTSKGALKKKIT